MQAPADTTPLACSAIRAADRVLYGVADPLSAHWLQRQNACTESFLYPRDAARRRDIYDAMVARIVECVERGEQVCAVFYGHPGFLTRPAHEAVRQVRALGYSARMIAGISSIGTLFADLAVDPGTHGCQIYEGERLVRQTLRVETRAALIICQPALVGVERPYRRDHDVLHEAGLRELTDFLLRLYPPNHEVVIYEAATLPTRAFSAVPVPLAALPSSQAVGELSTLYLAPFQGWGAEVDA